MGFIDWICEPNAETHGQFIDRVYDVEIIAPIRIDCPMCAESFESASELLSHTRLHHPLGLPLLLLGGAVATTEVVIRNPLPPAAVCVENCSLIELSHEGRAFEVVTPETLSRVLVEKEDGWINLRLRNERDLDQTAAAAEHRISFLIGDPTTLLAIEARFIESMQRQPISVAAAKSFWDDCGELTSTKAAAEFANALSNYVIGLAIKQGRDSGTVLPFDRFKDKFMEALGVLRHLDVPLAVGVVEVIRFNLNDFTSWARAKDSLPSLGGAAHFFNSPGVHLGTLPRPRRDALPGVAKCPVDDLTERIIEATLMIAEHRFSDTALQTFLPPLMSWSPLPEYDRQKLHVLMAAMHLGQGNAGEARSHLRALRSDHNFGSWAEQMLGT